MGRSQPPAHAPAAADALAVRVLVVEDHPALRAGLVALLEHQPGFDCVAAVSSERELGSAFTRDRPDVVVLDYAPGRSDGLSACFRLKQRPDPPRVVLYSGHVDGAFAVPAGVAQADAVVSKSAPVELLLSAIRPRPSGPRPRVVLDRDSIHAASSRLQDDDLPVFGMLVARHSVAEIADALRLAPAEVRARALRIIGQLQAAQRGGGARRARERRASVGWSRTGPSRGG